MTDESKLKLYETIYIVRPNLDEEGVDKTINAVEEFMKAQGVIIDLTDKKGRKRLAYEVKKMRDGYFVHSVLRAPAEAIAPVRRMMSLSEDVIRSLIVAIPPIALEVQAQL
ncbi:MAG: 30S ribosomal protein S6 [Candidatus Obscuribacterales bacterium]|nr:30S ribosomal protein S6 [Candidatus Obscuribacterales bacterium]